MTILAWDLGGAHIKIAAVNNEGVLTEVTQFPCALWTGLDALTPIFEEIRRRYPKARHALTMSGEMVDLFHDRAEGVRALLSRFKTYFERDAIEVFNEARELISCTEALTSPLSVASANWLAAPTWVGLNLPHALLIDVGSTTTDILEIKSGQPTPKAIGDHARLISRELVYTGVVRTPLMALTPSVTLRGQHVGVMAEYFATTADIYRILDKLPQGVDQHPTADGKDKSKEASLTRLARMVGADRSMFFDEDWIELAREFENAQLALIEDALTHFESAEPRPWILAGVGSFIMEELASRRAQVIHTFGSLVPNAPDDIQQAATFYAPAAALGLIAWQRSL